MKHLLTLFFSLLLILGCFSSCSSFGGIPKDTSPLNYSDTDVVSNEKKRIFDILQIEPVEAYWRALLLGDEETIEKCKSAILELLDKAVSEKDYNTALRYSKSLEITGYNSPVITSSECEKLIKASVPGLVPEKEKLPNNIDDCVNATVTILVDKGLKIQHGAGMADRVLGSGFFIDKRGYIVTNHHVIEDMVNPSYEGFSRLYIKLQGAEDEKIPAKVIGYDSILDLALLKAEVEPPFVLELGSSKELSVGDKISAIGAPLGLEGSITSGIVSFTERKLFTTGSVFQIDAPVNSGNSGGPCIDTNMKVQAIVFAGILDSQGLNFAIPVEFLKQELPYLYEGGEFNHCWIGCYGRTKKTGKKKTGLEILYVMPGSTSRFCGLSEGDIIYKVNDVSINSIEDMQSFLRECQPGTISKIFYRNEKSDVNEKLVYLEKRPEKPAVEVYNSDLVENSFLPLFGMKLSSVSEFKKRFVVSGIIPASQADELSFSENDTLYIKDIVFDKENKFILAQIVTQRHKKSIIDVVMVLSASYDNPYYF